MTAGKDPKKNLTTLESIAWDMANSMDRVIVYLERITELLERSENEKLRDLSARGRNEP